MNKLTRKNIRMLDEQLAVITRELGDETISIARRRELEDRQRSLVDIRSKLRHSEVDGSVREPVIKLVGSGLAILLILYYERTDIITSKAIAFVKGIGV